ncbi:MAG: cation diffusion facilitator family transporter [Candidatus Aenigmarchaeota archaeon]|nr:cation diffusion facilitator family transporter [Candidatus Aenigmarchaeota archaeon]
MAAIENLKIGERTTVLSSAVSALLVLIKAAAGIMSGSVALMTSALDSFSDFIGMITSWIGFKISQRKPDEKFPYGYYKAESISALFVSLFILYAAYTLLVEGYAKLFVPPSISMPYLALAIAFVSVIFSFGLSRYLMKTGKKINSELLMANAKERMADVATTTAVFFAVAMSYLNVSYVEGAITIFISLLILKVGIFSVRDSIFALMDVSPSKKKEERARGIISNCKEIEEFDDFKLRKSGPFVFGEVTIRIREFANVDRAHEIAEKIESRIKERLSDVVSFSVHIEPFKSQKQRVVIPVIKDEGLNSVVTDNFGRAGYFLFVDIDDNSVKHFKSKVNPAKKRKSKAGLSAVHFLIREHADVLVTRKIGEIAFHTLRDHLVDIYKTEGKTAGEVLKKLLRKNLKRMSEHSKPEGYDEGRI